MARQSVTKHLAVLEAADLITAVRRGREKLHYLNAVPDPRDRGALDRPLRRRPGPGAQRPQGRPGGPAMRRNTPHLRLPDLHPHHAREAVAGAHRARLHPALLGHGLRSDWRVGSPVTLGRARSSATRAGGAGVGPLPALSYRWHNIPRSTWRCSAGARSLRPADHRAALQGHLRRSNRSGRSSSSPSSTTASSPDRACSRVSDGWPACWRA